ncbi:hypothetical protein BD769DRAFT_1631167 [Suillus cothurnatus]|nr:hypothetical protein BD769DRAFT_1631167 [Suillus cothurnatus]
MSFTSRLSKVMQCLQDNGLSTSTFVSGVLKSSHIEHQDAKISLTSNMSQLCTLLNANEDSHPSVFSWAIALVRMVLCQEVAKLSLQQHGLHFRATSVTMAGVVEQQEMDLGEFGGDSIGLMGLGDDDSDDEIPRCSSRYSTDMAISICLQSSNEKCNYLQGWMGFFMKSTCVPEKVVEVLAHAGLLISLSSIHNAVTSVSKEISSKIRTFAYDNFNITFKTFQPTLENQSSFVSATSATVVPLFSINESNAIALKYHRNPLPSVTPLMNEMRAMMDLHKKDTYSCQINPTKPSP